MPRCWMYLMLNLQLFSLKRNLHPVCLSLLYLEWKMCLLAELWKRGAWFWRKLWRWQYCDHRWMYKNQCCYFWLFLSYCESVLHFTLSLWKLCKRRKWDLWRWQFNRRDGCSSACQIELGYICSATPPASICSSYCGNWLLNPLTE